MAAERYLSQRIPDLCVGNNIDKIDKKPIPSSIHPCPDLLVLPENVLRNLRKSGDICTAIFGRPGVISGCKNAQNVH